MVKTDRGIGQNPLLKTGHTQRQTGNESDPPDRNTCPSLTAALPQPRRLTPQDALETPWEHARGVCTRASTAALGEAPGVLLLVAVVERFDLLLPLALGQLGRVALLEVARCHLCVCVCVCACACSWGSV